jgi:hypothetical protein
LGCNALGLPRFPHATSLFVGDPTIRLSRASRGGIVRIPASAPDRRTLVSFFVFFPIFFFIFLGVGARGVFLGKSDQAVTQGEIGGIAGQTPAPFSLLAKKK